MTTAIAAKRGSSKEEAIAFTDKTTEHLFFYIGLTSSGNVGSKPKRNIQSNPLLLPGEDGIPSLTRSCL